MAAQRDEKAGVECIWRCVSGRVCGREVNPDGLLVSRKLTVNGYFV